LILINRGDDETRTAEVFLDLYAEDITSGVFLMVFSWDGASWMQWESYKEMKNYSIYPKEGDCYIYFKVMDRAGNIAEPVCNSIVFNKTRSTVEVVPDEDAPEEESPERVISVIDVNSNSVALVVIIIIFILIVILPYLIRIVRRHRQEAPDGEVLEPEIAFVPKIGGR
jgi:hypothetical protein